MKSVVKGEKAGTKKGRKSTGNTVKKKTERY